MPTGGPSEVAFAIRGPITRADLPGLCDRVRVVLTDAPEPIVSCDVHGVEPDAVCVDALARLQLAAQRRGRRVVLLNASAGLLDMVDLMGLANVLGEGDVRRRDTRAAVRSAGTGSRRRGRT
jgi:ABC-type transporter Mla MlaB component